VSAVNSATTDVMQALCTADPIREHLGLHWRRSYGRLSHRSRFAATLVYECGTEEPVLVELGQAIGANNEMLVRDVGVARFVPMRADPALPTLAQALDCHSSSEVVRYRPGKRCTFRAKVADGRQAYLKTVADSRGIGMWEDACMLFHFARRGAFDFAVAEPHSYNAQLYTVGHLSLGGEPAVGQLYGSAGVGMAQRLGAALATLPGSGMPCRTVFAAQEQMRRSGKYGKHFAKLVPELQNDIDRLLTLLERGHARQPDGPLLPIHGAPHPQQWLAGSTLGLVDFDRVCVGPVELDPATFVAEVDFENLPEAQRLALIEAFLGAYCDYLPEASLVRIDLYRAHKHFAKAFKTASAIRMDRKERAAEILAGALKMVARFAS
jgi:Phosphotransferase enzyme family